MKIQSFNFEDNKMIQIYISEEEQIDNLKNKYSNTSIFISGKNDTVKTIKEMLNYEKSKNVK